jgi:hypothetical protein
MTQAWSRWVLGALTILIVIAPVGASGNNATNLSTPGTGQTVLSGPAVDSAARPFRLITIDGQ